MHSTASDGECSPSAVARRAREVDLEAIALTDHDTVQGVPEATAVGLALGIEVIAGCEFSAHAHWGELHLLAYFLPVENARLAAFLKRWRVARRERASRMATLLSQHGVAVTEADILAEAEGDSVGRVHAARALVRRGIVPGIDAAFDHWLGHGRPAYVEKELPSLSEVAAVVHPLGGVLVAAHLGARASAARIRILRQQGLDGVEVRHPSHDRETEQRLTAIAQKFGLAVAGGSDWHGDSAWRDRNVPLGGNRVPRDWLHRLEQRRGGTTRAR